MNIVTKTVALLGILTCVYVSPTLANKPLVIGIAGGSGSGKTTLAKEIAESLTGNVTVFSLDSYYRDLSHLTLEDRDKQNFDAPEAIDFELFIRHLESLMNGQTIERPIYDFKTHVRKPQTEKIEPRKIILVEGILLFTHPELRDLLDIKIFIDVSEEHRLLRRIARDMEQRGRTLSSISEQYLNTVAPMYKKYVEPSKLHANLIVPNGGKNKVALQLLLSRSSLYLGT